MRIIQSPEGNHPTLASLPGYVADDTPLFRSLRLDGIGSAKAVPDHPGLVVGLVDGNGPFRHVRRQQSENRCERFRRRPTQRAFRRSQPGIRFGSTSIGPILPLVLSLDWTWFFPSYTGETALKRAYASRADCHKRVRKTLRTDCCDGRCLLLPCGAPAAR